MFNDHSLFFITEEVVEVFKVKKSSHSRRIAKQLKKESRKEKEERELREKEEQEQAEKDALSRKNNDGSSDVSINIVVYLAGKKANKILRVLKSKFQD